MFEDQKEKSYYIVCIGYIQTKFARSGQTKNGKNYYGTSIAVPGPRGDDGEFTREYISFTLWDDEALEAPAKFGDGVKARVTGKPEIESYVNKNGEHIAKIAIGFPKIELLAAPNMGKAPLSQSQVAAISAVTLDDLAGAEEDLF
jgi:hypothetical protein